MRGLSSLRLFLVAVRSGLVALPSSYEGHCREQRSRAGGGGSAEWLTLLSSTNPALSASPLLLPALQRMTEAFRSQLLHLTTAMEGREGGGKREAAEGDGDEEAEAALRRSELPSLADWDDGTGQLTPLLPLLYCWLSPFFCSAVLRPSAAPSGPLRSLPCVSVDLRLPLQLCGLPPLFQSLLSHGPTRRCPHCGSSRTSFPSPSSVASLLLCLLCGQHVCANSRMKCHLLHVAVCEGYRGCFLSLKRGDCVLVRLDQQPVQAPTVQTSASASASASASGGAAVSGATSPATGAASAPSTFPPSLSSSLSSLAPSPCVSLSVYSFCHWPSLYLDSYGESDLNLVRGRPLFLNEERKRALLDLLTQQRPGWEEHIQSQMQQQRQQQQLQQQHHHHHHQHPHQLPHHPHTHPTAPVFRGQPPQAAPRPPLEQRHTPAAPSLHRHGR